MDYIVERNRINYKIYEDSLKDVQGISIRRIPEKCSPLCDCLIFNFPKPEHAHQFVKLINEKGLSTKNIPDAIEWHFARHWDHIFNKYGLSSNDLYKLTQKSADILDRSVAIPVMVNLEDEVVLKNSDILRKAVDAVLVSTD